ncbi:redoxin domain-containing protein [Micromonospora sp. A3M-1-15]|uniref:redoxin domain-containing protein n=1 Tax=Micromonospora sp. A3M-1-15 TaxID=2962035 RepID=UPI0020B7333A|nr:redoxin domain-containing protein [Micromonospora sp. A3M-1-15]MCP3785124.1 redoxin domain-containing protein [Micromonospora sp. A3M-1-15]
MPGPRTATAPATAVLAAAILALAACGGAGKPPNSATAASSTAAKPTTTTAPGAMPSGGTATALPETISFNARTIDGGTFAGSSLAGKPAVLWFWAAWCTRCRAVADEVAVVQRDNAGRVNLVGVGGLGSGDEAMRRFARETGIDGFPNLADDDGQVWRRFKVTSQEHYVLLDSAGTVVHSGPLSQAELRKRVARLS